MTRWCTEDPCRGATPDQREREGQAPVIHNYLMLPHQSHQPELPAFSAGLLPHCPGPAATPAHPLLGVQHRPVQPDRGRGDLHALGASLATPSGLLYLRPETHPGQSGPSSWYRTASDAASSREWTPSLVSTAWMWVRTVAGEIWSLAAIAEVFSPSTRKPRQSRSRDVR